MQGSAERGGDQAGGSGEDNAVAAAGDGVDGEALELEPGLDRGDVGVGDAEAGGELVGREPLVIQGRGGVLLGGDESGESGLLGGGAIEDEGDTLKLHAGIDSAKVGGGAGEGRARVGQRDPRCVLDGCGEALWERGLS